LKTPASARPAKAPAKGGKRWRTQRRSGELVFQERLSEFLAPELYQTAHPEGGIHVIALARREILHAGTGRSAMQLEERSVNS
jgi:hypothetical protein